jgi:signal recognition particle subunit SRP68
VASATTAPSQAGTRDLQFVHGFVVYQLLSRRIERDLLLVNALVSQSKTSSPSLGAGQKDKKASSSKVT